MTVSGTLVCEKCGKRGGGHCRRGRWGTRRRQRRRARIRGAAITGILVAAAVVGILVMPGGLDALEGLLSSSDLPDSSHDDLHPPAEPVRDLEGGAPLHSDDGSNPGSGPRSVIDPWLDAVWMPSPFATKWNMSLTPGVVETQLVKFAGRGSVPGALKQVLILDSPTRLSFSFDNQSRVYHHFLLDEWYDDRGLEELNMGRTAGSPGGPPPLPGAASGAQPPYGKERHARADAPHPDSETAESLAVDTYGRSTSLDLLYSRALNAINGHRMSMGREPVQLSDNMAAQIHAQDVLEQLTISHYMSNGEKPYMTYSMTGGTGYVAQNVAFGGYDRPGQCGGYVLCTRIDPSVDIQNHHNGMMFDDAHADWGHRDNILHPHHTHVSIGVAYTDYTLVFVQNFEASHIDRTSVTGVTANPISLDGTGRVKVTGRMHAGLDVYSIDVYYDPLPSARTYRMHAHDMSYSLGDPVAYIYEPHPRGYISTGETILMADRWSVSGGRVLIEFDAPEAMSKNGAYTFNVWLTDGETPPFVGSSKTFLVGDLPDLSVTR